MAEKQASYIQASSHPADTDRLVLEALLNPSPAPVSGAGYGVGPATGDLLVTQNGTPNMSVNVAAGHVWIDGTEAATQGAYHGYNDATKNLVVAASDPTNPRKDLVIAKVQDAAYSGATNAWSIAVVTGTPAASPVEPAVPANAVVLAMINVAALATTITNANITDRRRRACGLSGIAVCTSTTRPAVPYMGQVAWETDTDRPMVWDGSAWRQLPLKWDTPMVRLRKSNQNVLNATDALLAWDIEDWDTDAMHDTVTNNSRLIAKTAGKYRFVLQPDWDGNVSGRRTVYVGVNRAGVFPAPGAGRIAVSTGMTSADAEVPVVGTVLLLANDYIEAWAFQDSGGTRVFGGAQRCIASFSMEWMGR